MTVMDTEIALFQAKRTALAFSLILLPGTVLHLIAGYPLFEAISATSIWLVPGLTYIFLNCRTPATIQRLLVFLLPFGKKFGNSCHALDKIVSAVLAFSLGK